MIPFIRRQKILEMFHGSALVYLDDLVKEMKVSEATIRRDLKTLSKEGHVDLLSGGAAKLKEHRGEKPLDERVLVNKQEKELIGSYVATLVDEGDFIFIGPGTTENTLIKHLGGKNITVVTNGAFHISALIANRIDSIILGGRIINSLAVLSGASTINQLKNMYFDKCFIGASGITYDGKLTTSDENVALANKEAINNSNAVYFIADSKKFGLTSRFEFARTQSNTFLITTKKQEKFSGDGELIIIK